MDKNKQEMNLLIKEIRDLITPKPFYIQLYKNQGLLIEAAWISDTSISTEEMCFVRLDKWKVKKCITTERLAYELKELESRIGSICRSCDIVAKNRGINKVEFFKDLLERAKK